MTAASCASTSPAAQARRSEHISWDEWFQKFDEQGLAAVIQEQKADGEDSTFVKLVKR